MYDVITIGSATLDIVVKSSEFMLTTAKDGGVALCEKLGSKMDVSDFRMVSGGGATNVAVGCARLGLTSAVVCEVGQDFPAQIIDDDLRKDRVETQFVVAERLEETAVSVLLVANSGGRTIITHRGAAYQLESRDLPWDHLHRTRWIHLGSLGGDRGMLFDIFEFLNKHEVGCSWTPSLKDLEILAKKQLASESIHLDVMILNKQEWEQVSDLHEELLRVTPMVVVTDGKEGGQVFMDGHIAVEYKGEQVDAVEETGAGDAFASGYISGILHGKTIPECVVWGKKNASSVIQCLGAKEGLLTKEKIEQSVV